MNFYKNRAAGFTLIELLVVIAIIGILASVVLASLNSAREKSRNAAFVSQIKEVQTSIERFYIDNGFYPANSTWTCVGSYPGDNCWNNGNYSVSTGASSFSTLISPYINTSAIAIPYRGTFEGMMYQSTSGGQGFNLFYILEGDLATCPIGDLAGDSWTDATRCEIRN